EEPVAGATERTYQITGLNRENMGDYRCEITNNLITDLTITSKVTTVLAKADISGSLFVSETEFLTAGEIRLLKVTENGAYDTSQVKPLSPTGIYDFENVILGDYVVIADPFDKDTYLPTYHENVIQWDLADIILLNDDTTGIDIFVEAVPVPFTPDDGNGAFGGEIFTDFPEEGRIEARRRVRRVGVALRRRRSSGRTDNDFEDFDLVAYTETDDEGKFAFDNLPPGTYRVFIEFPGIPIDPSSFSEFELGEDLDENEIAVEATVFEDGIVIEKVEETGVPYDYLDELKIYPNPATEGNLFITISAKRGYEIQLEVLDLRGVVVKSELLDSTNLGNGTRQIDVSDLSEGIYMIKISVPSYQNQLYKVGRIIINNR
ncbi:MAG: T9SS type A sorting domain-containing protein, partial [Cyclobacteriaceae bacterium]